MSTSRSTNSLLDTSQFPSQPVEMYNRFGFAVLEMLDEAQVKLLEEFSRNWIYRLLNTWTAGKEDKLPLETYHIWSKSLPIDHGTIFRAEKRHMNPEAAVKNALINEKLKKFLGEIGLKKYQLWDEGLGWLAFRFIRPGAGDGYPMSRKAWGVAVRAISCWVPIIGYTPRETLTLVPGSHLKEYPKYLPSNGKFRKDEYRLDGNLENLEVYNPALKKGQVIIYHPKILHSEEIAGGNITRLSLEFRIDPH